MKKMNDMNQNELKQEELKPNELKETEMEEVTGGVYGIIDIFHERTEQANGKKEQK